MTEPNDHIVTTPTNDGLASGPTRVPPASGSPQLPPVSDRAVPQPGLPSQSGGLGQNGGQGQAGEQERGTTAAQLRRFIKSRPYVPMHELRRRFELNGECEDVVALETPDGRCYIGLPEREGRFMADLLRQGEVGIELGHDPEVPIVVGVFPMRPVGR